MCHSFRSSARGFRLRASATIPRTTTTATSCTNLLPLDRRQVLSVYGWVTAVAAPLFVWGIFQDPLTKLLGDEDLAAGLCLLSAAVAFVSPYFLRKAANRR